MPLFPCMAVSRVTRPGKEIIVSVDSATKNVVLVHGAFVDGSGWRAVYDLLTQDGFHVAVVQNPTLSLRADAAATRQIIDAQYGPVVLVGHSYGGGVITEAGNHDKVTALVYIAALAPDAGESADTLLSEVTPSVPSSPILPPAGGFFIQDRAKFRDEFCGDLPAADAAFMADAQVPLGVDAHCGPVTEPAWRGKPSWYLITTEDHTIPPSTQRAMAQRAGAETVEVAASHAVYMSQPGGSPHSTGVRIDPLHRPTTRTPA
jgi:pimeloyl-ACP methyl ester carboxylesterase